MSNFKNEIIVTVYIISYNYGKFLEQAIESVLNQTFSRWELLIFNNGSNDETSEVMNLYKNDSRISLYHLKKTNLPTVANLAIKKSKGKYIIRLDADDFFDEHILLLLTTYLERSSDTALAVPDFYLIDENGNIISHEKSLKLQEKNRKTDTPPNGACTLIRLSVLKEIGGYREDLGAQDGFDLWSKIRNKYRTANVNLPLFFYRRHGQNLTNSPFRILHAKRQIKKDAVFSNLNSYRPILAVIPCRDKYDFTPKMWNEKINGKTLLEKKIDVCLKSNIFDKIIIASDSEDVIPTINKFKSERLFFFKRQSSETIRSKSLVDTLLSISKKFDSNFLGITVICYVPSPFVMRETIEDSVYSLIYNDSDSSIGVEKINQKAYVQTHYGLKEITSNTTFNSYHDSVYIEANIAIASKNKNFLLGSLSGPSPTNFVVDSNEVFFIDSVKKLKIANIIDEN